MKNIYLLLLLSISFSVNAQFPYNEEFNVGTNWTFNNGSGIYTYGASEYYASTNLGTTPYPNSSNITITSPVMNLSTCLGLMTISFPISGQIENTFDYLYFEYRIGGGVWNIISSYTGTQNTTYSFTNIPNTATQFRFRLQTNNTINTYSTGPWWNQTTYIYYYDISKFNITCNAVLPIKLISFKGKKEGNNNKLIWEIETEVNSDKYIVEKSIDTYNWDILGEINSSNANYYYIIDSEVRPIVNYYRLTQVDNDGTKTIYYNNLVVIDNTKAEKTIIASYNLLGQSVKPDELGIVIVVYEDQTTEKIINY